MKYPVAIQQYKDSCYGVTVPDIPGCFSAGESLDEAMNSVQDAISSHLEILAEDHELAPKPSFVESHIDNKDCAGATWAYIDIDIDVSPFLGKTEKTFVTLPRLVIRRIDALVAAGKAKNRSAFLADSALKKI